MASRGPFEGARVRAAERLYNNKYGGREAVWRFLSVCRGPVCVQIRELIRKNGRVNGFCCDLVIVSGVFNVFVVVFFVCKIYFYK